ncbi:gamma-glutamyl-gamma-aminobutyrate hydrolase family protein [Marinilactibacillus kalidii]|uniref:gamma-glutamyl-gamma-aminobutyrate hydrolase family protein n=1 Tax=Marinilactibacillus kalidii TaxID=2820274 RepID=UPI001ABDA4C4|nr:gamma-glutamyl-gamma-aminobutyrate hydrolase family protein [Marinilactibacillus kalidii]
MKPVIGILGNVLTNFSPRYESLPISYTPHGFVEALQAAGALPVIFPISSEENARQYVKSVDAILLAGGQDVSPLSYGEEPHLKLQDTSLERDQFEMAVIKEAWAENKPVLAICRGLQIFNVAFGGTLYQDVSLYPSLGVQHVQESTPETAAHSVKIKEDSWLGQLYGTSAHVNSYHHQAIKELAEGLRPVGWSSDGLIEAFESSDDQHITIGVQWHPELMIHNNKAAQGLFDAYVKTVIDWKKKTL